MKNFDLEPSDWISDMISNNINNFYSTKNGFNECYDNKTRSSIKIPGQEGFIILKKLDR